MIIIKDETTGEEFRLRTVQTAKDIFKELEELEKEHVESKVEDAVCKAMAEG